MKNLIIIVCALAVALGVYFYGFNGDFKLGDAIGVNLTTSATTTTINVPVKVLSANSGRRYALITNDSDTVVYIYLGNFASPMAASTTVAVNAGIRLAASGGTYTIDPDNLYTGQVWATSTAATKKLIYVEK